MLTIGLIGGMSWESTAEYYRIINERVKEQLGGLHSGRIALYSVDFAEVEALQVKGEWEEATRLMVDAGLRVRAGGADFIVICTNTMHRMAGEVEEEVGLPVLHIADTTAARILQAGVGTVGLLGTRFTMEQDFYVGRLEGNGLRVLVPDEPGRTLVHDVIYGELCLGITREDSKQQYLEIIDELTERGAEAVILGCTEIGLLVGPGDTDVPLFDTTEIHAIAAADRAIQFTPPLAGEG
jgi:aspartate racemase